MALLGADAPLLFMVSRMRPTGEKIEEPKRAVNLAKVRISTRRSKSPLATENLLEKH